MIQSQTVDLPNYSNPDPEWILPRPLGLGPGYTLLEWGPSRKRQVYIWEIDDLGNRQVGIDALQKKRCRPVITITSLINNQKTKKTVSRTVNHYSNLETGLVFYERGRILKSRNLPLLKNYFKTRFALFC